jgi:WD40 repeat protein
MRVAPVLAAWLAWPVLFVPAADQNRPFDYGPLPRGAWACLGSPRFVGDKPALSVAFSPDGKLLASGTGEYSSGPDVRVWDLATGQEIHVLKEHLGQIV